MTDILKQKSALRETAVARRRNLADTAGPNAGLRLADHIVAHLSGRPAGVVSGYLPMSDEIDPLPALARLIHSISSRGMGALLLSFRKHDSRSLSRILKRALVVLPYKDSHQLTITAPNLLGQRYPLELSNCHTNMVSTPIDLYGSLNHHIR